MEKCIILLGFKFLVLYISFCYIILLPRMQSQLKFSPWYGGTLRRQKNVSFGQVKLGQLQLGYFQTANCPTAKKVPRRKILEPMQSRVLCQKFQPTNLVPQFLFDRIRIMRKFTLWFLLMAYLPIVPHTYFQVVSMYI